MALDLGETIVALSSAPGPGARAIVRLSGQDAFRVIAKVCGLPAMPAPERRQILPAEVHLPGTAAPLPVELYLWPGPRTYTGQPMVEIHTLGCPPLVELLVAACLNAGARAAQAGEFTLRAFLAGKLDLTRAEAVLAVIEADNRDDLKRALDQLAGGVAAPLQELRDDLLNLLADLEAGLDFSDEDIRFVQRDDLLRRLTRGLAAITLVRKKMEERSLGQRPFRVVLAGPPNAGKSSLFNALAGRPAALVSEVPGTTRDYLVQRLDIGGVLIDIIDTAGLHPQAHGLEAAAQDLGRAQARRADLILWCVEPRAAAPMPMQAGAAPVLAIATKCDLAPPSGSLTATSAHTGAGLIELRRLLADRARANGGSALAPSLSRCRHHVEACLAGLRRAHALALEDDPPELVALELRAALDELGAMVGAVYTDDLLDRVFSRFCIGK
jgi:tRNA modification GTPase